MMKVNYCKEITYLMAINIDNNNKELIIIIRKSVPNSMKIVNVVYRQFVEKQFLPFVLHGDR